MKKHFSTMAQFTEFMGVPAPEHPLVCVFRLDRIDPQARPECSKAGITFSSDFYTIAVKTILAGEMHYGRTKYDFSNGSMMFTAPRQELTCTDVVVAADAVMIAVHEDLILGTPLHDSIRRYGFFSYAVNEALHLSPKEEAVVRGLMDGIHAEYSGNQDEFSKDLILSQIEVLLKYADRYYKRQFLNRASAPTDLSGRFETALLRRLGDGVSDRDGIPRVESLAAEMGLSGRYLSDALKAETGKTAQEHIHLHLLDEAKNLLLRPDMTIAEVSYRLGFEYPQYFSRLFRKKIGVTPKQFRDRAAMH